MENQIDTQFLTFLKEGSLGDLYLGQSIDEIITYLGFEDDVLSMDALKIRFQSNTHLRPDGFIVSGMYYDCLQLTINADTLVLLKIKVDVYLYPEQQLPPPLSSTWLLQTYRFTREDFSNLLDHQGILAKQRILGPVCQFDILNSGVRVNFSYEDGKDVFGVISVGT